METVRRRRQARDRGEARAARRGGSNVVLQLDHRVVFQRGTFAEPNGRLETPLGVVPLRVARARQLGAIIRAELPWRTPPEVQGCAARTIKEETVVSTVDHDHAATRRAEACHGRDPIRVLILFSSILKGSAGALVERIAGVGLGDESGLGFGDLLVSIFLELFPELLKVAKSNPQHRERRTEENDRRRRTL